MKDTTKLIKIQTERTQHGEHSTPMFLTSSFTFEDAGHGKALFNNEVEGNIYSRYSNPSVQEFIDKVCMLEGLETGFATASGMAAVFAGFAAHLESGDHLISSKALFGSAHQIITQILPKWGITHTYLEVNATEEDWNNAVQENTKMIYCETPSNPGLDLVDLEMLGKVAKKHDLIYYIDNCFATPVIQKPADFGADLIVHSATKFMDGQGRVMGGIIVGTPERMEKVTFFCRHTGPALSPFNAWVLSKSLETLHLRVDKHCDNALKLAEALQGLEGVSKVNYPFLDSHPQSALAKKQMKSGGALVTIDLEGGFERIVRFTKLLTIPSKTSNLGDTRTTITNPNTTTHSKVAQEIKDELGITEGLMRVSVGLEDIDDLIEDFKQAILGSK
ncbi:aminotransferase class I/II-fold pyridoxal phosphate-dependent enzyme [uncultured Arcticibacterium sp.]|uniref:trans-sulfuration enzyme family protein n=1 Tax=uncultured Arcticibacterium sp. TaxID=2173042 RepID=UPI0030F81687